MKTAAIALIAMCAGAFGEDAPATMTMLVVKLESPEAPKETFAAQPKRIFRAGSRYCRTEENPDLQNGIHGLMIINEPDVWMINRLDKTARHIVDQGPTFNCRMPIFVNTEDVKSAADVEKPLADLEFGRELEYFRPRSGAPAPGPVLQGKATTVYAIKLGKSELLLFAGGDPAVPVAVVRKTDTRREIFWYGEYLQLPFDAKLFAKPDGVKIEDVK